MNLISYNQVEISIRSPNEYETNPDGDGSKTTYESCSSNHSEESPEVKKQQ